jgi:M6 family metalloprotease-like protein
MLTKAITRLAVLMTLCAAAAGPVFAVPAALEPHQITQPDGTTFAAIMRGDEFQGWMETADGRTVVSNDATGYFEYAVAGPSGELLPSGVRVVGDGLRAPPALDQLVPKGLRPPRNTALEQYQNQFLAGVKAARLGSGSMLRAVPTPTGLWAPTPVSGAKKMLVILVNFANASMSSGAESYWNGAVFGGSGQSVATYYQDNSFGKLSISPVAHTQAGNPAGVVTVTVAQNHPNCVGGGYLCSLPVETAWINLALAAAAPYVDFASLDANGDGSITVDEAVIYFVTAGYEASNGAGTPAYWAHAWGDPTAVSVAGKHVTHWALNGEMFDATNRLAMGVIAHEMGHAMGGLPDLYELWGRNGGLGVFSLMARGCWGAKPGELIGQTPVALDAWSRQYLGWSSPRYPADGSVLSFGSALSSQSAPVMLMNSAVSTSEYWLVENRPPVGWDAGMQRVLGVWGGGLLIQHLNLNSGTSKDANDFNLVGATPQGNMAVEPSTSGCSLLKTYTTSGCTGILYYTGNSAAFNGASTPNSNYYNGTVSGLGVTNISAPGTTMTATVQTVVAEALNIQATKKVSEGAPQAHIRVDRTNGGTGAVSVQFATADGTATAGSDYTATAGTLNWADGDAAAKYIDVPIIYDTIPEPTKTFSVTLSNPTGPAALGTDISTVTLYDDDPATPFADVPAGYWAINYINALYGSGITSGCGGGNFCPASPVTRDQMAVFLVKAIEGSPAANYCNGVAPFGDVPAGYWACGYIKRLSELGITSGCGGGNFCPASAVTRDQMAVFLVKAIEGSVAANYCNGVAPFADVAAGYWACGYIKRFSELGITSGCGAGKFCPGNTATRDQMAVFLDRAFLGM